MLEKAKKEIAKKFKVKTNEVTYENFLAQCETTINKNDGRYKYEQNKKNLLINYYLLSNNEPNYEFYSFKLKDIFRTIFNYNDEQWKDQNVPLFNLTILNEALMSAENLIDERHEKLDEDSPITKHSQDKVYINYLEDGQKALVIGFGQNGQKALEHVYLDSNGGEMEKDMFIPTKFNAEILDPNIDKIITSYIATHPSFVFNEGAIRNIDYNEKCFDKLKERYDVVNFKELDKYMAFPRVFYKNSNYNEPAFIDTLDDICKRKYNVIIIALGDDEETIKCANTIIQSLRQSIKLLRNYDNKNLKIFINIKDHNNNDRLQWYDGDKKIMENVFIYKFGNLSKIYSTDLFEIKNAIKAYKYYKEIGEGINIDKTKKEINWEYDYIRNSSMYEKKTNESVYKFGEIYKKYLYEISDCTKAKNFYDLIKRDYQGYLECITDNSKVKKFKDIDKPYFDTEILCVVENIDSKIIENFKAIYETTNTIEGCRIKMNFANYKRLLDDNIFDDLNNIWRYLVQFEHSRWCRHMMIYGRAYTKEYKKRNL